jgi:hypothetical protein
MNFKRYNGRTWETVRHKRYGSGTDSLTAFPAVIQASGEAMTDYTIYGNTGGVGDYVLLPNILENNFQSQEVNGLTITVDGDSFLINGTSTANTNIALFSGAVNPSMVVKDYQVIPNGVYEINGNPSDAETGKYIISYRYDDAIGGEPASTARVPVGEPGILDSSSGAYRYLLVYIAIWSGVTLDNIRFAPTLRRKAYEIPVTSGGVTTNLYTDSPLGLTDALTYTDTGIALPTLDGDNTISFGTTVQPSGMSATFKGWHAVDAPKVYDGNDWR